MAALLSNKRGSEYIEASMVLPLIILLTLTMIMMIVYFYSVLDKQVVMHQQLNETVKNYDNAYYKISKTERKSIFIDGAIGEIFTTDIYGSRYIVNPVKLVKIGDFFDEE
ncbi:MAG: hypothetical protein PHH48_04335 [Eubacteriales bacterium]|nr:hypothetical protein [Eubacteriales bacterium]